MRAALLALLLLTGGVAVAAPAKKPVPKPTAADAPDTAPAPMPAGPHNEGEYGGVKPGVPPRTEPGHRSKRPPPKGTLAWIGFEAKNGGAEIFLQSVAPFELSQHVENGVLVVNTSLTRLGQNTWRQMDARFFDTPIARIVARHVGAARASKTGPGHGAGIEVRISFKNAKDAHEGAVRTSTEPDGLYYAYLSFAGTGGSGSGGTVQEPEK
jgi:hypothetical protein